VKLDVDSESLMELQDALSIIFQGFELIDTNGDGKPLLEVSDHKYVFPDPNVFRQTMVTCREDESGGMACP